MKPPVDLQPDEHVILLCRRHWMHLYPRLGFEVLVAVAPILAVLGISVDGTARQVLLVLAGGWLLFWGARAYFTLYRYNNDIWMITNQRLVDSLRKHWFHRSVASADLVDIEDVSVHREGLLRTVFNYGDVQVQTAGIKANFVLSGIPDPSSVLTTLDRARDEARRLVMRQP